MLDTIENTTTVVVTLLAAIGGILALPDQIKKLLLGRHPLGFRSTTWIALSKEVIHEGVTLRVLIADDVFKALSGLLGRPGAHLESITPIGELFDVTLRYPPGTDLRFRVVNEQVR